MKNKLESLPVGYYRAADYAEGLTLATFSVQGATPLALSVLCWDPLSLI